MQKVAKDQWPGVQAAIESGEVFECDQETYWYFLEVLPPIYGPGARAIPDFYLAWLSETLNNHPEAQPARNLFLFAEGMEAMTFYWEVTNPTDPENMELSRWFGVRSRFINPHW